MGLMDSLSMWQGLRITLVNEAHTYLKSGFMILLAFFMHMATLGSSDPRGSCPFEVQFHIEVANDRHLQISMAK